MPEDLVQDSDPAGMDVDDDPDAPTPAATAAKKTNEDLLLKKAIEVVQKRS